MKLSVCIPVYNFDVRPLVLDLKNQSRLISDAVEIILIDDGSEKCFLNTNQEAELLADAFVRMEKNIGRSAIRNCFLDYAKGDYLLFLDCDGKIISQNFISKYLDFVKEFPEAKVAYGGRIVHAEMPPKDYRLRWSYARKRENLPVDLRQTNPYLSFQTNNFLIKKQVFDRINFNPDFSKYGYEDLLFSMELKHAGICVYHLNNPVFNNDVESNAVYLKKVEESVENLAEMMKTPDVLEKIKEIRLINAYEKLREAGGLSLFSWGFGLVEKSINKSLLSGNATLFLLDAYKLGMLTKRML